MNLPSEKEIYELHKKMCSPENPQLLEMVWLHCQIVKEMSLEMVDHLQEQGINVNRELVAVGALVHDIGVYRCWDNYGRATQPYIRHGVEGEKMLMKENLPLAVVRFASHHIGVGLTAKDVREQHIPIEAKDWIPVTTEEELVAYADTFHSKKPCFNSYESTEQKFMTFNPDNKVKLSIFKKKFGLPDLKKFEKRYETWQKNFHWGEIRLSPEHEKCGIFGAYGKKMEVARLVHMGLWALQHRGQESSGISVSNGSSLKTHKGTGLVAHVYDEKILQTLKGYIAIGHNRYSTSGGADTRHNQPVVQDGELLALAHNGNLPSTRKLEKFLRGKHLDISKMNDSELMHAALSICLHQGLTIEQAITECFPLFTGVFSLLVMTDKKLVAVRDAAGVRPLSLGTLNSGYVISSETCAFQLMNASYLRDILPGEMVVIDQKGIHSSQLVEGKEQLDIFEFVYFSRPDSILLGKSVNEVRKNLGRNLAKEFPIKADVVIPVPDSAIPAALGYAEASHIPFDHGFIKNRYIHRTFIRPAKAIRETDVEIKLNILTEIVKDKDVIVIDDSIVRGTTSKKLVQMVRRGGAKKVHLLISSPPVKYPDFYGIDTPKQSDLLAAQMSLKDIENYVGANSVRFLSFNGMIDATGLSEDHFTTSCFNGKYPVDIGEKIKTISPR